MPEQNQNYQQSVQATLSPPPAPPSVESSVGFVKVKCPRSKSQPAFKDSAQINAINAQALNPTTNGLYNGVGGATNGIYGTHSNTNSNLNKYLGEFRINLTPPTKL